MIVFLQSYFDYTGDQTPAQDSDIVVVREVVVKVEPCMAAAQNGTVATTPRGLEVYSDKQWPRIQRMLSCSDFQALVSETGKNGFGV